MLLISNLFSVGPAYGSVCKELAEKLSEHNWHVYTTSAVKSRYLRPADMLKTVWSKRQNYSVAQIDVFSGSAFYWAESSAWLLRKAGRPYVLTLHGGGLPNFATQNSSNVHRLLNAAAHVTTPSRYLLEQMSTYCSDIQMIPNPLDLDDYTFQLRANPAPCLLYLRALHRMYNPSMAVQVVRLVQNEFPDTQLTMVGPDKGDGASADIRQLITSLRLQHAIHIHGPVAKSSVPKVMAEAQIFINTTNVDNTPVSVIEAMACGLCIVSTNVGGIPYLLTHDHDALLVPPNDPPAMAAAIRRILTEPGLAERLSRNARKTAEKFDWSIILPQWESLLTDVIEKDRRG